jgi:predicted DNA-binding protein
MDNMKIARAERRLVYMSTAQLRALKALARRTGSTQAALMRGAIDLVIAEASKADKRRGAR